jgi:hypothetical protein
MAGASAWRQRADMSAAAITVTAMGAGRWRVQVHAATPTTHEVTIPAGYLEKLGVAGVAPERVLEASFRFLLEREPNTSILRAFALPVIAQYFSEYEGEIAERVAAGDS